MILAIDPSFSSSGVALVKDGVLVTYTTLKASGDCYKSPAACDKAALSIVQQLKDWLTPQPKISEIIVEVPALQSKTGGYLAILHGFLVSYLKRLNVPITLVPCNACDSFIKNKEHSKTFIVNHCKQLEWVPNKRINNDVCTAVVLAHLLYAIHSGDYKNSHSEL